MRPAQGEKRREPPQAAKMQGGLSFGYFSLATQRKVTRPKGETKDSKAEQNPARAQAQEPEQQDSSLRSERQTHDPLRTDKL